MTEKEATKYYGQNRLADPTTNDYRRVGFPTNAVISKQLDDITRPAFEAKVQASADKVRAMMEEYQKAGERD